MILLLAAVPVRAAEAGGACVHRPAPAGTKSKRVAVVIGEGAYANGIPALRNPANDADAAAKAVGALGFEVFLAIDATSATLQQCLDQATAGPDERNVAMLYYSGHGIQISDENYLVATDAAAGDLKRGFVPVQPIVEALQKHAEATVVVLDACRNNPLAENGHAGLSVSTGRGLARIEESGGGKGAPPKAPAAVQARGLLVAYSTSPNAVAQDGTGALSPFTKAFTKLVGTSGYSIQRVMSEVNKAVGEETDYQQTPWIKSSLTGDVKLGGADTLDEAKSLSDNHAARAMELVRNSGRREAAIVEALKGLPAAADEAALQRFPGAYLALYTAMQSHDATLPLPPGHSLVAVSTRDRVAVLKQNADVRSGAFQLWSASERKVVADLGPARSVYKFSFSPHGSLLAIQAGDGVSVFDGVAGTKKFEVRSGSSAMAMDFSPDETRLMIAGSGLLIIDVATGKPTMTVKPAQLTGGDRKRRGNTLVQAMFGSNDTVCYILNGGGLGGPGGMGRGVVGVFDLKENKAARIRDTDESVSVMACDPAGKHMVRTFAVNGGAQGMEVWDLAGDKATVVKAPIVNIMGLDPKGDYASVIAFSDEADGVYDLAAARKGHPPTVPDGFSLHGSRVYDAGGALVNMDLALNPWRDWPDEALYGPALVQKAFAGLSDAQRAEVARERISFAVVAGNR